jgi:hypothetical protein
MVTTQKSMVTNSTEISHHEKLKHCTPKWAEFHYAARPHHNFFWHSAPAFLVTNTFLHFVLLFLDSSKSKRKKKK